MRKLLLFVMSLLVGGTMLAQSSNVEVVDNLSKYTGTETFVFNKADGKVYVRNNCNSYELYGVYEKVNSLKITQPDLQLGEYLKAPDGAYINLNYIPKNNTRAVAVIKASEGPDWKAVYGCGYDKDGWKDRFCFFSTNATIDLGGETGDKSQMVYGQKIWTVLDAAEGTLKIYDDEQMTNLRGTVTDSPKGETNTCKTPLYVFAQNKDYPAEVGDRVQTDCYNPYIELYNLKIYEGTTLVFDLIPVLSNSKGALKDKVSGKIFYSENDKLFEVGGIESGITVYPGKMVYNTTDNKVYKYNGNEFEICGNGERTLSPIASTDYKNMKNWICPNEHWSSVYGDGSRISWDENTGTSSLNPYVGTSGWEPLSYKLTVEPYKDYNVSFTYGTGGWGTWDGNHNETDNPTTLPFKIIDRENYNHGNGRYNDEGLIAYAKISPEATDGSNYNVDFTSPTDIATFILQFGVVDDGEHTPAYWFSFSNWLVQEYVYPESYPAVNPFGPLLADLIPSVENYDGNITTALKNVLNEALTSAKAVAESSDLAAQKEAYDALKQAFDNVKALNADNFTALKNTIALAKEEGLESLESESFFEAGTTNDELDKALKSARIARKQNVAERQPNVFKGNVPAKGDFYLYNVGQQRFLTGGSDWGAHAALGMPGTLVTLEPSDAADGFFINTHLPNGSDDNGTKEYMNYRGYMDCPKVDDWYFVEVGDGKYNIYQYDYKDVYVKYNPDASVNEGQGDWNTVGTENHLPAGQEAVDPEDLDAQWILVTKEERLALMENASAENPVDVSFMIVNPGFNQRAEIEPAWTLSDASIWERGGNHNDFTVEAWNKGSMVVDQVIKGLEPGFYEVSVQGYYRDGNFNHQVDVVSKGEEAIQNAALYAQYEEVALPNITVDADKAPGLGTKSAIGELPNNCDQAAQYFQNGLYRTSVVAEVDASGELAIGIYKDEQPNVEDWVVADNFRIKYLGATDPGIDGISEKVLPSAQKNKIFNLQGVELKKAEKAGIYISNGKKFIKK